ncbi:putative transporter small subunit [Streptomyces sp. enrichment culture]|uniref:putative transporter small subunit n=1 Tax=Streptomyces sp. enrichment culture TaxID=1795815 RepID=UPI003F5521EC
MSTAALTAYVLMWPVLVAVVLFVIGRGFFREWAEARRKGEDLIRRTAPTGRGEKGTSLPPGPSRGRRPGKSPGKRAGR